ncbi:hypothetical protein SVIO_017890 [Streptomyces violaceusniger]|uniref:AB hydrolase-1 domain-containing protein n=1 Tax=Streptomyces violaceusniger TaxID=68280 RepID=A0A4D4KWB6_STRVO|nr:hypothetical protein SVIO_017890 [Streptomyces violaceusniger]
MTRRSVLQSALADLAEVPATSRWVRSGDVRLHALDYGGGLPALVVLPGITSPAVTMDFVARELTDLVRPVVLDVRGRGLSDEGEGYGLEEYAEDTEALITHLGLDRPLLLGHSMGARIAAAVAVRAKVPLRGTVLADPPMSGPDRGPYPTPGRCSCGSFPRPGAERTPTRWPPRGPPGRGGNRSCGPAGCPAAPRRPSWPRTTASSTRTSSTGGPGCPDRPTCSTEPTVPS